MDRITRPQGHTIMPRPPEGETSSESAMDPASPLESAAFDAGSMPAENPSREEARTEDIQSREPFHSFTGELPAQDGSQLSSASSQKSVEAFLPTDYFSSDAGGAFHPSPPQKNIHSSRTARKRNTARKRRIVASVIAGFLIVCLAVGGTYAYNILHNPAALFQTSVSNALPSQTPSGNAAGPETSSGAALSSGQQAPSATLSPLEALEAEADTSILNTNILNILVIGVDYAEERETWNGKHDYHSDVMMLIAINLEESRVDLISLPRDTYAKIPGVNGIYKLNASLNCGGGMEAANGAGFLKVCEAASWMLGGIPVNYYYAVTMPAVKQLVDAFGGVDYELELNFTMAGRSYKKGLQHMDGQAVLDYLRVRKNIGSSGDLNRVNRQKQMMIALFKQMQTNNLILKIPDIINAFSGQLFTNCTAAQTAALAAFAYRLDSSSIGMHSMSGPYVNIFGWNFVLTDQANRVEIIKEVYNYDAPQELEYSKTYASCRWQTMLAKQYLATCSSMTSTVKNWIEQDDLLPEAPETTIVPDAGSADGFDPDGDMGQSTPSIPEGAFPDPQANSVPGVVNLSAGAGSAARLSQYQQFGPEARANWSAYLDYAAAVQAALSYVEREGPKYLAGEKNSLAGAVSSLTSANSALKTAALQVAGDFGYSSGSLRWSVNYWDDSSFNEIYVDFR